MDHDFLIHSSAAGHLSGFQLWTITNGPQSYYVVVFNHEKRERENTSKSGSGLYISELSNQQAFFQGKHLSVSKSTDEPS